MRNEGYSSLIEPLTDWRFYAAVIVVFGLTALATNCNYYIRLGAKKHREQKKIETTEIEQREYPDDGLKLVVDREYKAN